MANGSGLVETAADNSTVDADNRRALVLVLNLRVTLSTLVTYVAVAAIDRADG